ncbi:MAG: F0F1 ATP synthase subunit B [Planctomycetales bacterium]|nr:F0F1 ATP synthase subunit B [Planctomycetales bacterium]
MLTRVLLATFMLFSCSALIRSCFAQEAEGAAAVAEVGGQSDLGAAAHEDSDGEGSGHGSAGHEEHDTDPTHANMSDAAYQVTEFRQDMAFFSALVFLILLVGLTYVGWKPIMEGLEKRERGIAENISSAERASKEAAARLAEYEAKLAAAAQEAQSLVAEARKDAEAAGQKLIAAAQEEAVQQRERAISDIESAKRVALGELAAKSTDIAMSLAQRVVGREVNANDHQGLIQDMISKLPSNN